MAVLEDEGEVEQVEVLGEGRGRVWEFHEESANGAANSVGEWPGELLEAGFTGGMAAGEDAWDGGYSVVRLQTHRALRWLRLFHGGVLKISRRVIIDFNSGFLFNLWFIRSFRSTRNTPSEHLERHHLKKSSIFSFFFKIYILIDPF